MPRHSRRFERQFLDLDSAELHDGIAAPHLKSKVTRAVLVEGICGICAIRGLFAMNLRDEAVLLGHDFQSKPFVGSGERVIRRSTKYNRPLSDKQFQNAAGWMRREPR